MDESQIYQKGSWLAHGDVIKSIQYVPMTAEPLVLTASADQFVHIWSFVKDDALACGKNKGTLRQGTGPNVEHLWDFQLDN